MNNKTGFPEFKELELKDRDIIHNILWRYQPEISELTFTNMFVWRNLYKFMWGIYDDQYLMIIAKDLRGYYGFEPIGPGNRTDAVSELLKWLNRLSKNSEPRLERIDSRLAGEIENDTRFKVEKIRDHFDYLYSTRNLIDLAGRRYHSKRNHLSGFLKSYSFSYEPFTSSIAPECLNFSDRWCQSHNCRENHSLCEEWKSIKELLNNYVQLELKGAVIRINGQIEAFTFGELLNNYTAVVHYEKANAEYRGLYTAINQMFCEHELADTEFINREQDLGDPGLRKAKESYYPSRLVEKFRITPA